jgi:hypothetical protein
MDILGGFQIQIDMFWYNILLSVAGLHWNLLRGLILMGYTIELVNNWLMENAFVPLITQTNSSLSLAMNLAFVIAMLILGITYLLAAFVRLEVVNLRSALQWYIAGALFFSAGPALYQGMNDFRIGAAQAFYASTLSGLESNFGTGFNSLNQVTSSELGLGQLCDYLGVYLPSGTGGIDGLDVALAYLRADGPDVMGYPYPADSPGCPFHYNHPITSEYVSTIPTEWYQDGSYFSILESSYFSPDLEPEARTASEWNYDPNPDIASFINGMSVRPVMGIPYSEDNAVWFANMDEGTVFTVTMNTGAMLRFDFAARSQVRRSDTDIFRQVSPGLVLLLIGERDEEGLPTATRTLITATYPPEQELGRDGELVGLTLPDLPSLMATETSIEPINPFTDVDVQIISITTQLGQLTARFRIYNGGSQTLHITGDDIQLALGYEANPVGPFVPAENLTPSLLLPEQAFDLTIDWAWAGEPYSSLQIGDYRFNIQF